MLVDHALGDSSWPLHGERHTATPFKHRLFAQPKRFVAAVFGHAGTVVAEEDNQRVLVKAVLLLRIQDSADAVVESCCHCRIDATAFVFDEWKTVVVFLSNLKGAVNGGIRQV